MTLLKRFLSDVRADEFVPECRRRSGEEEELCPCSPVPSEPPARPVPLPPWQLPTHFPNTKAAAPPKLSEARQR